MRKTVDLPFGVSVSYPKEREAMLLVGLVFLMLKAAK